MSSLRFDAIQEISEYKDSKEWLIDEILRLKKERDAVILAHNYQIPEIQDLADFVGDSLGLSQAALKTKASVIEFCGVHFMAETAAILNPEKKVLIPDLNAGCSLVESSPTAEWLREWKRKHPNGVIVSYINTTAALKAESDYCCTSSNAVKIVESIPQDKEILFIPDMFLGAFVEAKTGRKLHVWHGECHVHAGILPKDIVNLREKYPNAEFLIHPECSCASQFMCFMADGDIPSTKTHILSTEGMIHISKASSEKTFLVATETGILYRLRKENTSKSFLPVKPDAVCKYMKMNTLEKLHHSLKECMYEVRVAEPIASRAKQAIDRMLEVT